MFKADSDQIGEASKAVKEMCDSAKTISSCLKLQDNALSSANSGMAAQSQSGKMLMLRASMDAFIDGIDTYRKDLHDASSELTGDLTTKRQNVLVWVSGTVSKKTVIACEESANMQGPCSTVHNTAESLENAIPAATDAARGLDNGGHEVDAICEALSKLRLFAGGEKELSDSLLNSWNTYVGAINIFEAHFSGLFSKEVIDKHAQETAANDKDLIDEYGTKITEKLPSFLGDIAKYSDNPQEMGKLLNDPKQAFLDKLSESFKTNVIPFDYLFRHSKKGTDGEHLHVDKNAGNGSKQPKEKNPSELEEDLKSIGKSTEQNKNWMALGKVAGVAGKFIGRATAVYNVYDVVQVTSDTYSSSGSVWQAFQKGGKRAIKDTTVTAATDLGALVGSLPGDLIVNPVVAASGGLVGSFLLEELAEQLFGEDW
ncbi:hypothetical protein OZX74_04055 [Bifidobacterium sp. ESL0798]|uniref:hypothetical protein n=1 Tax=Bifidobacterium sp. ESL0798 TaxID=2983235 RepID=UPI0023F7B3A8|nr:hypothetical protein [Bifidobacterium sp. ESL0798]WEV74699.1 hypothetical protein OZX74_04055 [Bifidobacterium sp. ESL0798]